MSGIKKWVPHLRYLEALGFEVLEQRHTGGTHVKFKVTYQGKERFLIAPNSPSDRRAFLNWKCDARKIANLLKEEAKQ